MGQIELQLLFCAAEGAEGRLPRQLAHELGVDDAVLVLDLVQVLLRAHQPVLLLVFLDAVDLVLPAPMPVFSLRGAAVDRRQPLLVLQQIVLQVQHRHQPQVGYCGFHLISILLFISSQLPQSAILALFFMWKHREEVYHQNIK